jgi:hypothetical protein
MSKAKIGLLSSKALRLRDMPSTVQEAVARDIARFLVVFPGVERAAFVGTKLTAGQCDTHCCIR